MTLIYDTVDSGLPQTHALIIGVNEYPYLPGGIYATTAPAPINFGLGQLTSPVPSATALVDWLLTKHDNPDARLGSVDVLLSPGFYHPSGRAGQTLQVASGSVIDVEVADFAHIQRQFRDWYWRLNRHADNIGIFYFCGHGLEATDRYLLPADFGADADDAFSHLINFTKTHINTQSCMANTLCFFLDACREQPHELLVAAASETLGKGLIGKQTDPHVHHNAPIFHAAVSNQLALGLGGNASYFMEAFLECLNGLGANQADGHRAPVDHQSILIALTNLMERKGSQLGLPLKCDSQDSRLHRATPTILHYAQLPFEVMSEFCCVPKHAQPFAQFQVTDSSGRSQSRSIPDQSEWKVMVSYGACKIRVRFGRRLPYRSKTITSLAFPPLHRPLLDVT